MHASARGKSSETRRRIAVEAARLIADQGMRDYHAAKLKAAARLGFSLDADLPRNAEIEAALREHQRLFQSQAQSAQLSRLRMAAVEAMQFFQDFEPRLVGAVLEGTADAFSAVCLHLFADNLAMVTALLGERSIPYRQHQRRLRMGSDSDMRVPVLEFAAGANTIDLTIFPRDGLRQAPWDRISDRPMRRASISVVRQLSGSQAQGLDRS